MDIHLVSCSIILALLIGAANVSVANGAVDNRERSFDSDWRFLRADASGAESPSFDDKSWRLLDLPHDWSIEDLPSKSDAVPSPFDPSQSAGGASTGYTVGGIGWYRKHFKLPASDFGKKITIRFDGVYMNSDVWINGSHLGNHPYGYTPFTYDLTPYLKPAGKENVLAVQVKNVGKTSRWYSGSGIYRHVWLTVSDPVHIPVWGVHVVATNISKSVATISISTTLENSGSKNGDFRLRTRLIDPNGKVGKTQESEVHIQPGKWLEFTQNFLVSSPILWSLKSPALYQTKVEVLRGKQVVDHSEAIFGIRSLEFCAAKGLLLNGEVVKLKGGCMHHDNGPLGSATIDRAEERRVQLMKAYGFNAIRTSHNPPSPAFLDACDRYGVLVLDEAFDMWEKAKNPDDYHLNFDEWWQRDLEAMILRDRNHPSVILWSIGNEISERADPSGVEISKKLADYVRKLDSTRPVTEAICGFWDHPDKPWSDTAPAFTALDVCGYNYQTQQYIPDHKQFPSRIIVGTESFPGALYDNWREVLADPWVIGDFVWTAWDYLGETGTGGVTLSGDPDPTHFPWYNAWCGDIDVCGFEKPAHNYRAVIWGDAKIRVAVHAPIPSGQSERVAYWGWPDERQSWTWPVAEGTLLDVAVYSSCPSVKLELNGEEIGAKPTNNMIARFQVPYHPGELRATGILNDASAAVATLRTAGEAKKIRLVADRSTIRASRDDLSYVTVEVVDNDGNLAPNAALPIHFTITGAGELAAVASSAPNDPSSFHLPVRKTYQGRCLVILRPKGNAGEITLKAESDGLRPAIIKIKTQ